MYQRTFIFADVLQGEGQAGIFALYYSYFSKSALSNHSQELEMIEVDCISQIICVSKGVSPHERGASRVLLQL